MSAPIDLQCQEKRNVGAGIARLRAWMARLIAVTMFTACAELAAPAAGVFVEVRVPPVVQAELSLLTDFSVSAQIVNDGPTTILYDRWCNWRIQQLVNGTWAPGYTPLCSPEGREILQLRSGESVVVRYPAHRSWRSGNGAQIQGSYRLVLTVYSSLPGGVLTDLEEVVATSNTFTVR